jgi:hypothetical protein
MNTVEIHDTARRLFEAHGDKAELEAAQKARLLLEDGDTENAEDWKRIRQAIAQMRGSHVS